MRASWSRRVAGASLGLVLGILAFALSAGAASGEVKRAGGIAYVTKSFERDAGYRKLRARCPRDTHVLSGGTDNNAPFNQAALHHSYPVDARDKGKQPDDGWKVEVTGNASYTFRVYAICADRRVKYVKRTLAADASGQTNQFVICPGSLNAVGGGNRGSQSLTTNSGFVGGVSLNEWDFFVDNQFNGPLPFTGFAICVRFSTERVLANDPDTPAQALTYGQADCPARRFVVGGGLSTSANYNDLGVNSTFPGGFAGPPARVWSVWTDNRTTGQVSVTAQAICAPALR